MHEQLVNFLKEKIPKASPSSSGGEVGDSWVVVDPLYLHPVCRLLKDDPQWDFHILQLITGCDYLEEQPRIEVSYFLTSIPKNHDLIIRVVLPREKPSVDSVSDIWIAANFQERECYDMLGVTFKGHGDLRRILCPEDWEGYPLRRDYEVQKSWHGIEVSPEHKMNLPEREFEKRQREMREAHEKGSQ